MYIQLNDNDCTTKLLLHSRKPNSKGMRCKILLNSLFHVDKKEKKTAEADNNLSKIREEPMLT